MKQFQPSESLAVGFLLALTGGLLDAYSYLNRGEVFATAETGNLVLPEGLSELGACAFHSCRNLRGNLRIPQGVVNPLSEQT